MCGIVGYIGKRQAAPILLDGLDKLEYRGYDSAGIAVFNDGKIQVKKARGRLKILSELTHDGQTMPGTSGIGHTRWATHGEPSDVNAHPHFNKDMSIAVVHNGIIENHESLKNTLIKKGYKFISDTDTEVVAHMLDYYWEEDPLETITHVLHRIDGSYALGILFKDHPDTLYAARKNSPLIVGKCSDGAIIASDVPAVLKYTRDVIYLDNGEIAAISENDIRVFDLDCEEVEKETVHIDWDAEAAEKGGYEHFMLKEIFEQPKAVLDTISPRIKDGLVNLGEIGCSDDELKKISNVVIIACGSSNHVGHTARYVIEDMARVPVRVELASEFRYRKPIVQENTLIIAISQSGETADTLEALREAKKLGCKTLSIVNVLGSSIARESDMVLYTYTGPEIAVATTKAYSAQLAAVYLFAIKLAYLKGQIDEKQQRELVRYLEKIPEQIKQLLCNQSSIQKLANRFINSPTVFFIGRGIDYAISMEGSLKLKEISYIHSEAYAAGELKHGTISLVEKGLPTVAVMTQQALLPKTLSNATEVKTRGGYIVALTEEGNLEVEDKADHVLYLPKTRRFFTNSLAIIPLQLLSYFVSTGKGIDPDKPRNLAKSVTVE